MKIVKRLKRWLLTVMILLFTGTVKMEVYAAQGNATFGSESYLWYTDRYSPLGVYMTGETPIAEYEICLEYDPTMLAYEDGATEVADNKIYIRGTGTDISYKTMLHFRPLQEGNTVVQVVSVRAVTAGDADNDIMPEEVEITETAAAPITIAKYVSNGVTELHTEPTDLPGFSADVSEYWITVESEVEKLNINYVLEDEEAEVNLSETKLAIGENTITLSIRGTDGRNVYTFYVTRKEPVAEPEPEETIPPEEDSPEEVTVPEKTEVPEETQTQSEKEPDVTLEEEVLPKERMDLILAVGVLAVVLLILSYVIHLLEKRKKTGVLILDRDREKRQDRELQVIDLEQTVIDIQDVTMRFKLAQEESSSLKEYMIRSVKGQNKYRTLTALNHISFEVKQGDVVGIIGTNGSGKSTLLKIVSGAIIPSEGTVQVDRSKVQMLTLGTGFDMELTAKENVYLNGAIIGYTREYIDENYEKIVEFAELEGFMDERMKNFSSGMVSRLGFAIATMRDTPDILILDEVLSVGDMFFRQKSEERIQEMIHSGATVIIVSHSMDTIQKNCNKVVWIEKGDMKMIGSPKEVCAAYRKYDRG